MATKHPARFIDEDNYDSCSSSPERQNSPSQPPSKKQKVYHETSSAAGEIQPHEPTITPPSPSVPTNNALDELVEEHPETRATPTDNLTDETVEGNGAMASGTNAVAEAAASDKNVVREPAADGEADEAEEDGEDQEEAKGDEYLFGPSEDSDSKKSVSEKLPWIRAALKAAGLDTDGNELPPEESDY